MRPNARGIIKVVMHAHSRPPCLPSVARSLAPISLAAGGACVTLPGPECPFFRLCSDAEHTHGALRVPHRGRGRARVKQRAAAQTRGSGGRAPYARRAMHASAGAPARSRALARSCGLAPASVVRRGVRAAALAGPAPRLVRGHAQAHASMRGRARAQADTRAVARTRSPTNPHMHAYVHPHAHARTRTRTGRRAHRRARVCALLLPETMPVAQRFQIALALAVLSGALFVASTPRARLPPWLVKWAIACARACSRTRAWQACARVCKRAAVPLRALAKRALSGVAADLKALDVDTHAAKGESKAGDQGMRECTHRLGAACSSAKARAARPSFANLLTYLRMHAHTCNCTHASLARPSRERRRSRAGCGAFRGCRRAREGGGCDRVHPEDARCPRARTKGRQSPRTGATTRQQGRGCAAGG